MSLITLTTDFGIKDPFVAMMKGVIYSSLFHRSGQWCAIARHRRRSKRLCIRDHCNFGNIVTDYVCPDIHKPYKDDGILKGEIIYIDKFGNLFTNISWSDIEEYRQNRQDSSMMIGFRGREIAGIKSYYSEAKTLEFAGIINSFGLLEIYSYTGNAARLSNANKGDREKGSLFCSIRYANIHSKNGAMKCQI